MQKYVTALQKYEGESWYSGNEIALVDGELKLKAFICRDNSENRKKILKIVDSPKDIVFGNGGADIFLDYLSDQSKSMSVLYRTQIS